MQLKFECKLLHPLARTLQRSSGGHAGYDLYACIDAPLALRYGENATLIPTGIAVEYASLDIAALILPKYGMAHRSGLVLGNTVGLVGAQSEEQWFVSAWNRGPVDEIVIRPGDPIAQVVFIPVLHPEFEVVSGFKKPVSILNEDPPLF